VSAESVVGGVNWHRRGSGENNERGEKGGRNLLKNAANTMVDPCKGKR